MWLLKDHGGLFSSSLSPSQGHSSVDLSIPACFSQLTVPKFP